MGERLLFMLAAYNAGQGNVRDARDLIRRLGRSPDRWDENVAHAMGLLSESRYARKARLGYVRRIQDRYRAYLAVVDSVPSPAPEVD